MAKTDTSSWPSCPKGHKNYPNNKCCSECGVPMAVKKDGGDGGKKEEKKEAPKPQFVMDVPVKTEDGDEIIVSVPVSCSDKEHGDLAVTMMGIGRPQTAKVAGGVAEFSIPTSFAGSKKVTFTVAGDANVSQTTTVRGRKLAETTPKEVSKKGFLATFFHHLNGDDQKKGS